MNKLQRIRGVLLPLPTIFDGHGKVDEPLLRDLTRFYLEKGVHAFFLCGSYGQGPAMSSGQRKHVVSLVADEVANRAPIVVHIGSVDPYTAIELGRHARSVNADAVALVGPYYYSDRLPDEIILHFKMIDEAVQLPLLVYDNPMYQGY